MMCIALIAVVAGLNMTVLNLRNGERRWDHSMDFGDRCVGV